MGNEADGETDDRENRSPPFADSMDFEATLPAVAAASRDVRRRVEIRSVEETMRSLFALLGDSDEQASFLDRAYVAIEEMVAAEMSQYLANRPEVAEETELRGGSADLEASRSAQIVSGNRDFLENGLYQWMEGIYENVNADLWLGASDDVGGIIDLRLIGDAIGLNAWSWGLEPTDSPFLRYDSATSMPLPFVVMMERYGRSVPISVSA